ncbi:MAG TPA: methionyl-tRNA formyltransferase [Candidatus Faecimonas gallistercoris]|nr:methionyl-tRNA formyltransferase [Candidatus Faecimonas gallistercoris]
MRNVKVIFMGTPDFSVPVLEGLIEHYDVVGVVSQPDRKVGRKQEVVFSPVKKVALQHNILVFQPEKIRVEYADILDLHPDIIVTCAYGQIIPKEILDYPKYGCINVHASLLPKLRGGAPIHKAIIDGYHKTGITIMYMDEAMDSGDIISQRATDILDSDTTEDLHDRLSVMGKELLLDTLPSIIDGTAKRIKQDESKVTYAYNIKREEEYLDFSKTSLELFNQIRGLCPFPGSSCIIDDREFKVYASRIGTFDSSSYPAGEILHIYKDGIGIATGDFELVLLDIKPFGKKRMLASSFINGIRKEDYIGKVVYGRK